MSMTDDNTNELDSYGVWVKNSSNNPSQEDSAKEAEGTGDDALDLPDFDTTDFSDMFKDDAQFASDQSAELSFSDDLDSTLSTDELANITDSADISVEAASEEITDTDLTSEVSFDDFMSDTSSESSNDNIPESKDSIDITEETFDTADFSEEIKTEETTSSSEGFEEVSFEDEEISLDDFMTEGFSDESVAAGNNGYEPGAEPKPATPSSGTEELSLDDFLDDDSFDMAPPEVKQQQEEVIEDEPPLEMEINFDDSADSVETEENIAVDSDWEDDIEDNTSSDSIETEEISLDDFGSSFDAVETKDSTSSADISTEEVDLSDFGIDADAEETPITQNVEESKNKEVVVDYDLSVGDENTSAAPVVNEIKAETPKQEEKEEPKAIIPENSTVVENSLLQQIVADLSGLKDEINRLKQNLEDIKNAEAFPAPSTAPVEEAPVEEEIVFEETKEEAGFFGADDGDETIALSCDELNNIMNNAAFSEATDSTEAEDDFTATPAEVSVEETADFDISEEAVTEEPVFEAEPSEQIVETPAEEESVVEEEPVFDVPVEESINEEEILIEEDSNQDMTTEEVSFEDTIEAESTDNITLDETDTIQNQELSFDDNTPAESIFDESESVADEEIAFDFTDDNLEEPVIDEIAVDEDIIDSDSETDLPEEITIPKEDEMFVESTSSDFMDSVKDNTDETVSENLEEATFEETAMEEDIPLELPEDSLEETEAISENDDVPTVEKLLENENTEISFEDTELPVEPVTEEEPIFEETPEVVEEVVIPEEETAVTDETEIAFEETSEPDGEDRFAEVDNLDNSLSESNISFLTEKEQPSNTETVNITSDLKQDIKSVLLYMDQLLENLPEEKIIEFAKSDEFTTYKKLFTELGLS